MRVLDQPLNIASDAPAKVTAWQGAAGETRADVLAVEEPLEIRLAGCPVAVTMRTPGDDLDLALGFLYTEGILHRLEDVDTMARCPSADGATFESNVVNINPRDPALVDPARWTRNFYATSSCGICGKASIQAVRQEAPTIRSAGAIAIESRVFYGLDTRLRESQHVFDRTGGLHGAGLFTLGGELVAAREDVGRHNAVDKIVGDAFRSAKLPLTEGILLVSGRASFEIVQKAAMAGIPILAAVSAPSTLAVELARESGMTLIGFLRSSPDRESGHFNVYAGEERVR